MYVSVSLNSYAFKIKTFCIFNTCTLIIKNCISLFMLQPSSDKLKSTGESDRNVENSEHFNIIAKTRSPPLNEFFLKMVLPKVELKK